MSMLVNGVGSVTAQALARDRKDIGSAGAELSVRHEKCANFFAEHGISTPSLLFDTLSDTYYFAKNRAGQFVWGNRLLQEKHSLLDVNDIIGKTDHDFFRRDIADRIRADDLSVMERGVIVKDKLEVIGGDNGELTWLFTTKAAIRNSQGEVVGIEGFSRDAQRSQDVIAPFREFKACIEYLQEHLMDSVSIDHLAKLSCMSLSTFERKFKQHFALTPKQYILHMKVHEACRLLPTANSIARVAMETGFGGQSYFTKQFRSVVGITPKQYQLSLAAERASTVRRGAARPANRAQQT
ncbi:AraC family transcriptional regulator [Telluria mixta]|uniref:AraC family transcriptional regulator n=1 Tax=Telluria mixta TaxID=34071 RepID=A0ABT2BS21_9BURK|nr:AraC family transcriptional regulator [Telluria mixta]MCS0627910.1 AraC family transcriptional regulator [Telluria mixta]WEM93971.1 AraC family transcriptional regulator [Telluria mixta]